MDSTLESDNQLRTVSSVNPDDGNNPSDFEVKIAPDETNGVPSTSEKENMAAEDERQTAETDNER